MNDFKHLAASVDFPDFRGRWYRNEDPLLGLRHVWLAATLGLTGSTGLSAATKQEAVEFGEVPIATVAAAAAAAAAALSLWPRLEASQLPELQTAIAGAAADVALSQRRKAIAAQFDLILTGVAAAAAAASTVLSKGQTPEVGPLDDFLFVMAAAAAADDDLSEGPRLEADQSDVTAGVVTKRTVEKGKKLAQPVVALPLVARVALFPVLVQLPAYLVEQVFLFLLEFPPMAVPASKLRLQQSPVLVVAVVLDGVDAPAALVAVAPTAIEPTAMKRKMRDRTVGRSQGAKQRDFVAEHATLLILAPEAKLLVSATNSPQLNGMLAMRKVESGLAASSW